MTVREPEYSASDRALLLADLFERNRPRGSHGIPLDEATDPKNAHRYEAQLPARDYAQQVLNKQKAEYRERYPDGDLDSLLWRVAEKP